MASVALIGREHFGCLVKGLPLRIMVENVSALDLRCRRDPVQSKGDRPLVQSAMFFYKMNECFGWEIGRRGNNHLGK
jgi:hypothetical protein